MSNTQSIVLEDRASAGLEARPFRVTVDCARDFRFLDGLRSMTLKFLSGEDFELQEVLNQPVTRKEMEPSKGQVQQGDRFLEWPQSQSPRPPLGSVIVGDDGEYWTILSVTFIELMRTYRVQCRNLAIRPAEENKATILEARYTRAPGNDRQAHWRAILEEIPARFQPSQEAAQIFLGGEYIQETYRVLFQHPVPVHLAGGQYRLRDSKGFLYRVQFYLDEERIDTLPVAICVRIMEPSEYPSGMLPGHDSSASGEESGSSGGGSGSVVSSQSESSVSSGSSSSELMD